MAARPWLTEGNLQFIRVLHDAVGAHFQGPAKEKNLWDKALPHLQELQRAHGPFAHLQGLGLTKPVPPRSTCKHSTGTPVDNSSFAEPADNWSHLFVEDAVASFGRGGPGAVATMAEAMLVVNGLARTHGAGRVYFRGEHQYGWALKSRAQRKMEQAQGAPLTGANGISKREIDELRRFQAEVKAGTVDLGAELVGGDLPGDDDPDWLPLMEHYDVPFGTRLLNITRSIFAGLHFACIDWDGSIDFDTDGLLYLFLGHGRYLAKKPTGGPDDEVSEFVPGTVTDAFANWSCPEYLHHFNSSQRSMRELAQDGVFLVQGDLGVAPVVGGQGTFKLCVPGWAKARIIEELWFAGFTPERIVRGAVGKAAADKAKTELAANRKTTVGWHSGLPPF